MLHIPSLNLNNFEEETFAGCQYVLTSPRSLEACSRVDVKPKDLLYKGLVDFQAELLPLDLYMNEIYQRYSDHERMRQRTLKLCRDIRHLISSQENDGNYRDIVPGDYGDVYSKRYTDYVKPSDLYRSEDIDELDRRSLELKQTTGVVVSPNNIAAYPAIERRLNDIKSEIMGMNKEISSSVRINERNPRARSASPSRGRKNPTHTRSCSSLALNRENRPSSADMKRKHTRSPVSFDLPFRDRKILDLMARKEERNREDELRRRLAHEEWEREKEMKRESEKEREARRKQLLREEDMINKFKLSVLKEKQKKIQEREREEMIEEMMAGDRKWAQSMDLERQLRETEILNRVYRDRHKKVMQETQVEKLEKQVQETKNEMLRLNKNKAKKAQARKSVRVADEIMKTRCENMFKSENHRQRMKAIDYANTVDQTLMETRMDGKHSKAQRNIQDVAKKQDDQLYLASVERERKFHNVRVAQEEQDREIKDWQTQLTRQRKQADTKASKAVRQKLDMKTRAVSNERGVREQELTKNVEKIMKDMEVWEKRTKDFIAHKDRRIDKVKGDKENYKHRSRALARKSETLRDKFKVKHGRDSLEKKAHEALMLNKMERGGRVRTSQKNRSSVKIAYM